ncbi:MAG TPA: lipase maturation factor family protein [Candidatus Eremiobacteraceae bacterium]|nr:lipase maturation factor family protein [Candidatus Eremiobacteraceae bacterium]
MNPSIPPSLRWFAGPGLKGPPGHLLPRWLFLRAMGIIYFSAFYSLVFQIRGLIGPDGLLPARTYLQVIAQNLEGSRYWYAPTLLWLTSGDGALMALCWIGMIASLLLVLNLWPRGMLAICFLLFLSFVSAAQDFSGYQSDGMLLTAGFICLFFAPSGFRPGWGASQAPSRGSLFLLQILWFTIYFESGIVKWFGGDPSWRNLTAMDEYYQNGPLPTWIGWYVAQMPEWFHKGSAAFTLIVEVLLVWLAFLPRPFRIVCFWIVTVLQVSIILTANYAFLNYLVLALGVLLLDDRYLLKLFPKRWTNEVRANLEKPRAAAAPEEAIVDLNLSAETSNPQNESAPAEQKGSEPETSATAQWGMPFRQAVSVVYVWVAAFLFAWLLYANLYLLLHQMFRTSPLPAEPVVALEPFRVANAYGLFGRMTWRRYEIEFQGSDDGEHWTVYPFCYKPQDPAKAPEIYAPYQPRFEWNMWFASLGEWRENTWVLRGEQLLLVNDEAVVSLFASNPFPDHPPKQVRTVLWRYWFTDLATKRATGMWWRREYLGLYAPSLAVAPDGKFMVTGFPETYPAP